MAYNKVILIGRVASDLELKQTPTGKSVISLSLAIRRDSETADFFSVVAWNQTAEFIAKYFHKGDGIGIDGELTSRKYEKNGNKYTVYEVLCKSAFFTEGAKKEEGASATGGYNPYTTPRKAQAEVSEVPDDGDLPF